MNSKKSEPRQFNNVTHAGRCEIPTFFNIPLPPETVDRSTNNADLLSEINSER